MKRRYKAPRHKHVCKACGLRHFLFQYSTCNRMRKAGH